MVMCNHSGPLQTNGIIDTLVRMRIYIIFVLNTQNFYQYLYV